VLAGAGATLPARDAVDLRIVREVRDERGRMIDKETDLPLDQQWPAYRALPAPPDADRDGLPDFWEQQVGLNPADPSDSAQLTRGYANIEHYFNNTDPVGARIPSSLSLRRCLARDPGDPGEWRIIRTGDTSAPLTVKFQVTGDAASGRDFATLMDSVTIPAGSESAVISLTPLPTANNGKTVIATLSREASTYHVGCPSASLLVIAKPRATSPLPP
jgi:hypothetical protein